MSKIPTVFGAPVLHVCGNRMSLIKSWPRQALETASRNMEQQTKPALKSAARLIFLGNSDQPFKEYLPKHLHLSWLDRYFLQG